MKKKYEELKQYLSELGSVLVAFSSGVDSTFLLKTAHDVLGNKCVAVTARSCFVPDEEIREAKKFCINEGIEHIVTDMDVLSIEGVKQNPTQRCYLCKTGIFTCFKQIATERNIPYVVEGSNLDDTADYRPGMKAIAELDIKSPLMYAKLTKDDIRALSKELGLPTWKKPSFACLASRFPYGDELSEDKLKMVESAENFLKEKGFTQYRVRVHKDLARIEVEPSSFEKLIEPDMCEAIVNYFKGLGFAYVSMDLFGYKTGSMNIGID